MVNVKLAVDWRSDVRDLPPGSYRWAQTCDPEFNYDWHAGILYVNTRTSSV